MQTVTLKRVLSLSLLTYYGLGTILGAGIYALVGKVAKHAGMHTPIAFLLASVIAVFTAMSYAELGSRLPRSAGGAYYIKKAFHIKWLSGLVGWMIVFTGVISAATIAHAFAGYLQLFISMPTSIIIILLMLALGALVCWGIKESAIAAMVITFIEVGGLLLVIGIAGHHLKDLPQHLPNLMPAWQWDDWSGVVSGAFIAFYAFIGFEDMANLAEEVKSPEKALPLAIGLSLAGATLLYIIVALVVVLATPIAELSQQSAPLAFVVAQQGYSTTWIGVISLIAVVNGALVQVIMASRLIYGMAHQHNAPPFFAGLHEKKQTPIRATVFVVLLMLTFALWLPIETLAKTTNTIMLCVFALINAALITIKHKSGKQPGALSFPVVFPVMGLLLSLMFLLASML